MNEGQAGIAVLAGITLISSLVWHFFYRELEKQLQERRLFLWQFFK